MKRIGVMGGTFNPPHLGHLEAARHVHQALQLDKVLFVPTNLPPHKTLPEGGATTRQRCRMVELMIQNEPWAELSEIELQRGGASYTVDTLHQLRGAGQALTLIVGTDMLLSFEKWKSPQEICNLAALAAVARQEDDIKALEEQVKNLRQKYDAEVDLVPCDTLPISSTQLREEKGFRRFTAPAVADYIAEHHLYRCS